MPRPMAARPPISPDGLWYWDGAAWRTLVSTDGAFVWTGQAWTPRYPTPAPGVARSPRSRWAWAIIGGGGAATLALVLAVSLLVVQLLPDGSDGGAAATAAGARATSSGAIPCEPAEQLTGHYHAHLALFADGRPRALPARIGLEDSCIRWIHTHDSSGLVHVEIPQRALSRMFVLGDVFAVWDQPLSESRVAGWPGSVTAWVQTPTEDRAYRWQGEVPAIPLGACDAITLEVGPVAQPDPYSFPRGFGCGGGGGGGSSA